MALPDFLSDSEMEQLERNSGGGSSLPDFISDDDMAAMEGGSQFSFGNELRGIANRGMQGLSDIASLYEGINPLNGPSRYSKMAADSIVRSIFNRPVNTAGESGGDKLTEGLKDAGIMNEAEPMSTPGIVAGELAYAMPSIFTPGGMSRSALTATGLGALGAGGVKAAGGDETQQLIGSLAGAGIPGLAKGAAAKIANVLDDSAHKLKLSAYGANKTRIGKAINRMPDVLDDVGKFNNPLSESIEAFEKAGGDKVGMDPAKLIGEVDYQYDNLVKSLSKELSAAQRQQAEAIIPEFKLTEKYVEGLAGVDKAKAKEIADELISNTVNNMDGTIMSIQDEKIKLSQAIRDGAWGADTNQMRTNILKRVRADLRESIEQGYSYLTGQRPTKIKELNEEIGKREALYPMFKDMLASGEARNPLTWAMQNWRTSGGFGLPALLATHSIGGPAAMTIPLAGMYASSPSGRLTASKMASGLAGVGRATEDILQGSTPLDSMVRGSIPKVSDMLASEDVPAKPSPELDSQAPLIQQPAQIDQQQYSQLEKSPERSTGQELPYKNGKGLFGINYTPLDAGNQPKDQVTEVFEALMKGPDLSQKINSKFGEIDLGTVMQGIRRVESADGKYTTGAKTKYGTAKGDYQLLDSTGKQYHKKLGIDEPYDPYNDEQAQAIASAVLVDYLDMFDGDLNKALTAYHTGPGNVQKGKIGPKGRAYAPQVEKVIEGLLKA